MGLSSHSQQPSVPELVESFFASALTKVEKSSDLLVAESVIPLRFLDVERGNVGLLKSAMLNPQIWKM